MIPADECTNVEVPNLWQIISSQLWLQTVVFFKEKNRNIFLLAIMAVVIVVALVFNFITSMMYRKCEDG